MLRQVRWILLGMAENCTFVPTHHHLIHHHSNGPPIGFTSILVAKLNLEKHLGNIKKLAYFKLYVFKNNSNYITDKKKLTQRHNNNINP